MARIAHYYQDCPTCGRTLQIRVEYLGRILCCPHCRGQLRAADPSGWQGPRPSRLDMVDRANALLDSAPVE